MKITKIIDGKSVEIEISQEEALGALELDNKENAGKSGVVSKLRSIIGLPDEKDSVSPEIKILQEQLKGLAGALNDEQKARKVATDSLQAQAQEARSKEIKSMVADAIKSGKVVPGDEAKWVSRLEKEFEISKEVLSEIPASKAGDGGSKEKSSGGESSGSPAFSVADYLKDPGKYSEAIKSELSVTGK